MLDFSKLENFDEVAIFFSKKYKNYVQRIYTDLSTKFPQKNIYLIPTRDVICAAKCRKYCSYVLVGIQCPLHRFENAVQFKIPLSEEAIDTIIKHNSPVVIDSIYHSSAISCGAVEDLTSNCSRDYSNKELLVITESQQILDYYTSVYENVKYYSPNPESSGILECEEHVKYLMKENTSSHKLTGKRLVGVVFTSIRFESLATDIANEINKFSRAYKIYLRDVSYERLISIDHLDCIVLVDCPLFSCKIDLHIPVLSPFAVNCFINKTWASEYERNHFSPCLEASSINESEATDIVTVSPAGAILESRWYKGALFQGEGEDDMEIHQGRKGIPLEYENEGYTGKGKSNE